MTLLTPLIVEEGIDSNIKQLTRKTVRAIIMNEKNEILLAYSSLFDDYTFPGGGIKSNENEVTALKRELKEEFGAEQMEIIKPIFTTQELKYGLKNNHQVYLQTSIYYLVKIHLYGPQHLVGREIDHGLSPMWVTLDQAITHNQSVIRDERHQQKGIKTALIRDNRVLTYLKENIEMRKFEVVSTYLNQGVTLPKRATEGSAGYDLASIEDVIINPQEIKLIPTGLKVMMPKSEALFVFPRSSLAIKKGIMMSNSVGVVDSDYYGNKDNEGHIMVPLINIKSEPVHILKGERIAQGIFLAYNKTTDDETENIVRLGGFGSSGK